VIKLISEQLKKELEQIDKKESFKSFDEFIYEQYQKELQ